MTREESSSKYIYVWRESCHVPKIFYPLKTELKNIILESLLGHYFAALSSVLQFFWEEKLCLTVALEGKKLSILKCIRFSVVKNQTNKILL